MISFRRFNGGIRTKYFLFSGRQRILREVRFDKRYIDGKEQQSQYTDY